MKFLRSIQRDIKKRLEQMSKERECKECKHFKLVSHSHIMDKDRFPIWSCEKWDCEFEKEEKDEDNN